jgi:hypothetical protein|tara:strand:- start:238 stop:441 length:204 start_codon:yes stop_codon:yes gene_type:complete
MSKNFSIANSLNFKNIRLLIFENQNVQFRVVLKLLKKVVKVTNFLVEDIGVEPMTSCVQGRRSSQLS